MQRVGAFLVALGLAIGCGSGQPRSPAPATSEPQQFVERLLAALDREDDSSWRDLLSARMRGRMADPQHLHDQLVAWRRDVLPLAPQLRRARLGIDITGPRPQLTYAFDGGEAIALATVASEDGKLHLDEN